MKFNKLLMGFICMFSLQISARAAIELSNLFSDHMVLQREMPIEIWGTGDRGEKISLIISDKEYVSQVDQAGNWTIKLEPQEAGGPYDILIKGNNTIELKDIVFGDVWVCSGQSNMQWEIHQTPYQELDTAYFKSGMLRFIKVHIDTDYLPQSKIKGGVWQIASIDNVPYFSAVAYHFGKFIQQEVGVPIGLVSSNLGATSIEAWMSNESLLQFDQFKEEVGHIVKRNKDFHQLRKDFLKIKKDWEEQYYLKGPGIMQKWYLPTTDISDWRDISVPGFWEDVDGLGLQDHDGAVWMRKQFDLPEGYDQDSFLLQLTQIDDYDITWVNGVKVGETYGRHNFRNYMIGTDILKPKDNAVVIRIFDIGDKGGFSTNAFWMGSMIRGGWKIKKGIRIEAETFPKVDMPNVSPFSSPGVLYNSNIAPLIRQPIKGVIWYQGESNASRAEEYRSLFPAMISDWRRQWNQDFPFLFVQLANYLAEDGSPKNSNWAELREAQNLALEMPKVGIAVAIDIGEANDIHPGNKLDVGKRLGQAALHHAYGKSNQLSPIYRSAHFDEQKALISFDNAEGLHSRDKFGYIKGFAIAGADREFVWAQAKMIGDKIQVYSDQVLDPVAVRYGWSDNPGPLDLYNKAGLPLSPFRTDNWPGGTDGKRFDSSMSRF